MSSFFGTSEHSLDDKGRLIVPKRFLEVIRGAGDDEAGEYILTAGFEGNLLLLSRASFDELAASLGTSVDVGLKTRLKRRLLLGHAERLRVDSAGRAVIPEVLRSFCGLVKDAVLTGVGSAVEIWSKEAWMKSAVDIPDKFFDDNDYMVESTASVQV